MKWILGLLMAVVVGTVSCERHDFEGPEGTKQLHIKHGAAHESDEHAKPHGESTH